jgi:hypothetical protein
MSFSLRSIDWEAVIKVTPELSFLRRTIDDENIKESLTQRARSFRTAGNSLHFELEKDAIFDPGTESPTDALIVALVRDEAESIRSYLAQHLGRHNLRADEMVSAFFIYKKFDIVRSRKLRAPVFFYCEALMVRIERKKKDLGLFLISENGVETVFYTTHVEKLRKKAQANFESNRRKTCHLKSFLPPQLRYYGLHTYVPVFDGGQWKVGRYGTQILLPRKPLNADVMLKSGKTEIARLVAISRQPYVSARFVAKAIQSQSIRRRPGAKFSQGLWDTGCGLGTGAIVSAAANEALVCAEILGPIAGPAGLGVCAIGFLGFAILGVALGLGCALSPDPGPSISSNDPTNDPTVSTDGDPSESESGGDPMDPFSHESDDDGHSILEEDPVSPFNEET